MKLATPLMTVATAFVLVASHQAHAGQAPAAQQAALVAAGPHAAAVAQADIASSREYRASEPWYASPGKRGARAAAQQGPEALRRYIDRTRMIYALDYREFARF